MSSNTLQRERRRRVFEYAESAESANPARRAVERYWLVYTPLWGIVALVIMLSGAAERWGDRELMTMGIAFALGAVVPPLVRVHPIDRARPLWSRTSFKLVASVVGLSFLMNYFCTPYFFDVLHMRFGFAAKITIDDNPVFLYFMTVAYFATYSVLLCGGWRLVRARAPALAVLVPFAVAFLETVLNANPFMRRLFCFDDMRFMLWFGTLSYGACFVFALPMWMRIDDDEATCVPLTRVAVELLAAMMAIVITFALLRHQVAPLVTDVHEGQRGYGGCLER